MDPKFIKFSDYLSGFEVEEEDTVFTSFNGQYPLYFNVPSPDLSFMDVLSVPSSSEPASFPPSVSVISHEGMFSASTGCSTEADSSSPCDASEFSDPALQYISSMLMEDNMEEKAWEDPLVLKETERMLSQVLGEQYASPINQPLLLNIESSDSNSPSSSSVSLPSDSKSKQQCSNFTYSLDNMDNGLMNSSCTAFMVKNIFFDTESILQFRRGFKEASKFLPNANQLIINLESSKFPTDGLRGGRSHKRGTRDLEESRGTKQSAVYVVEDELVEMFDKVLLCTPNCPYDEDVHHELSSDLNKPSGGETPLRRPSKKKETGDLMTLLNLCAKSISCNDVSTANKLLKQIMENSSPSGDGSQRLAHYFANALEVRMIGSEPGIQHFSSSLKKKTADSLEAHKVQLTASPFRKLAFSYANKMICKISFTAKALHIVDFGISYGFQWPIFFQHLAARDGGPPNLRITGIELPQSGFKPAEIVEETGRHLARYCQRFNVPFEYNSIAVQNWETIDLNDLKLDSNEVLAVNHIFRFKNLLDETAETDCPRNLVLKLIRKMNPDIFIHSIVNGSFSSPFFEGRFREALNHYSAIFDMLDTAIPREDPGRLMLENELFGHEAMNVVACEGVERHERPESYKQWQFRLGREGFKALPLNQELLNIFSDKVKCRYHKDFILCEDGPWMLQGWKGRILYASSCWISS